MELEIVDLDDGHISMVDVPIEDQPAARVFFRPSIVMQGVSTVLEFGGFWEKPPFDDDRVFVPLIDLDSDSLQIILLLLKPNCRQKIKKVMVFKRPGISMGFSLL